MLIWGSCRVKSHQMWTNLQLNIAPQDRSMAYGIDQHILAWHAIHVCPVFFGTHLSGSRGHRDVTERAQVPNAC